VIFVEHGSKFRVLIIGVEVAEILVDILRLQGYEADLINYYPNLSPDKVFVALNNQHYDLVIAAYWPLIDILLDIRKRFPSVKTIFINTSEEKLSEMARDAGVNHVTDFPSDIAEFLEHIRSMAAT
jgi:hypothetical protein